jgi:hypothetical protein
MGSRDSKTSKISIDIITTVGIFMQHIHANGDKREGSPRAVWFDRIGKSNGGFIQFS